MKPHVAAGAVQVVAQPIGLTLLALGHPTIGAIVEAIGGAGTALAAYLTQQGE